MTTAAQLRAQITTSTLLRPRYRTQLLRLPDKLLVEIATLSAQHPSWSVGQVYADVAARWPGIQSRVVQELRKVLAVRHPQRQGTGRVLVGMMLGPFALGAWYAGRKGRPRQFCGLVLGRDGEVLAEYRVEGTSEVCRMAYDSWSRWAQAPIEPAISAKVSHLPVAGGCGTKSAA